MFTIDPQATTPYYLQLKSQFADLIRSGVLKPGAKLPPTRQLAGELNLNRNTVLTAYDELEADGLVYSHVGQGTFVEDLRKYEPDAGPARTAPFNWPGSFSSIYDDTALQSLVQLFRVSTAGVHFSFGSGAPPAEFYPRQLLKRSMNAVLNDSDPEALRYGPIEGSPALRDQLARMLRESGVETNASDVFITNGSQQAIAITARALVNAGDTVLTEDPTYTGALSVFRALRVKIVGIPMERDGLDMDFLESACRQYRPKLLYTIPNFHNPTGRTLSLAKRKHLMSLVQRFGLPVVEDDVFGDLRLEGDSLPPLKAFDHQGQVIYLGSMSKKLIPGLRIGYAVIQSGLRDRFIAIKCMEDLGANSLAQALLTRFIARGYLKTHLRKVRRVYRQRRDTMIREIRACFPAEAALEKPQGGLFLWVTFPAGTDLTPVFERCLRQGIVFSLGSLFDSAGRGRNAAMRLSFAGNPPETIREGIRAMGRIVSAAMVKPHIISEEPERIPLL